MWHKKAKEALLLVLYNIITAGVLSTYQHVVASGFDWNNNVIT